MNWLSESSVSCVDKRRNYNSHVARKFIVHRKGCPLLAHLEAVPYYARPMCYADSSRDLVMTFKDLTQRFPNRSKWFAFRSDKVRKIGVHPYDEIEVITPMLVVIRDLRNAAR